MGMGIFRRFPAFVLCALALALVAVAGRLDSGGVIATGNYSPSSSVTLSSNGASAVADTTYAMSIGPGQLNFGGVTAQFPGAACGAPGPEHVSGDCAAGARPALGDVVGTFSSETSFGLTNTPCSSVIVVTFTFQNATVDNSPGNAIYPSSQAEADAGGTLSPLLHDVNSLSPGIGSSQTGAVSPANGLPGHVDRYPSYLNTIFDPDGTGPLPPLQPLARYSGGQVVAGTSVVLTIPVFAPGAFAAFAAHNATNPYADMAATNLGYVAIPVLQDPTAPQAPSNITDFCTPVSLTSVLFGESRQNPCQNNTLPPCHSDAFINNPTPGPPTGRVRWQNPSTSGTHYFGTYQFSQRDLDNDGIENSFDTCPYTPNTDGDPRVTSGPDADMLDSSCDPQPAGNNPNQDGDGAPGGGAWLNAGDNCPNNANTTQIESELSEPDNIRRPRGGTPTDSLGDECDGPESGAACGNAVDDDGDTLINDGCPAVGGPTAETECGSSPALDGDGDGYPNDGCPAQGGREIGSQCSNATDDDSDGLINDGCPAAGPPNPESGAECNNTLDEDQDGFANDGCPAEGTPAPESGTQCANAVDDDADGWVNDGCPAVAVAETGPQCANASDDDLDGFVNDGCAAQGSAAEPIEDCYNGSDDDGDGVIDDGCPAMGPPRIESGAECENAIDEDGDGFVNDGCPTAGPPTPEDPSQCGDYANSDPQDDNAVNDGCPAVGGPELGCLNSVDDEDRPETTGADGDGAVNDGCPSSSRVANGHYHTDFDLLAVCIGGVDNDGDGYCSLGGPGVPNDPSDSNAGRIPETYSQFRPFYVAHSGSGNNPPASREPTQICNDGIDNDGDTLIDLLDGTSAFSVTTDDCRPPDTVFSGGVDADGDGGKDEVEIHVGTDALGRCGRGPEPNGLTPSKAWPWDLRGESSFSQDRVNIQDLSAFNNPVRHLGTSPGDTNFDRRFDVRPGTTLGKWINVSDLAAMVTAAPVPMFGVRAFGGPVCSAHPVYND
jgi:hypothetical protein